MAVGSITMRELLSMVNKFRITAEIKQIVPIRNGHIHDTYHIRTAEGTDYLLQQVNTGIFHDVDALMANISKVLAHLEKKHKRYRSFFPECVQLISTWKYKDYLCAKDGKVWRIYNYIQDSHVYNRINDPSIAYQGGRAFGAFFTELSDLPAKELNIILPRFHDFNFRYEAYQESLADDAAGRKESVSAEIAFVSQNVSAMKAFNQMILAEEVPVRITHNDTKFNNVLFNEDHRPLCVIDLDTVMPGSVLHDFGDAIRTAANSAEEDEPDLGRVKFDLEIFRAFSRGYLENAGKVLTEKEIESLPFSPIFLTFLIGLRFLTDYLNGDIYYKTVRPGHNLDRARVQFEMVRQMQEKYENMKYIIQELIPVNA